MRKNLCSSRCVLLSTFLVLIVGCGLDADLPPSRGGNAAPVNTAVTVSGAGTSNDADAGSSEGARITDIRDENGAGRAANDPSGGTDRGGAFNAGAGNTGGATSPTSGAAGAGGHVGQSPSKHPSDDAGAANGDAGSGGAAGDETAEPPVLWFSEYVEGSSSNKALEIAAGTSSQLDDCKVAAYFNGKTEATVIATLSGALQAGQVLTLCTSALKDKLGGTCAQVGNLTFNGDDAIALSCQGKIIDVIGQIGVDPGTAWGNDANSTADHTLRRKCVVQQGATPGTELFDPSAEWQPFPLDTFDGLGVLGC